MYRHNTMQMHLPTTRAFSLGPLSHLETILQMPIWVLYFATINVEWTNSWIKLEFLPESVAPHLALLFPFLFIGNAFWFVPKYLNRKHWWRYFLFGSLGILLFEVTRTLLFVVVLKGESSLITTFNSEFFGNNSPLFGVLNIMTLNAIFWSFFYRVSWDWFVKGKKLQLSREDYLKKVDDSERTKNLKSSFPIRKKEGVFILWVVDVIIFQAQGDFVIGIDSNGKRHIINTSLKYVLSQLDKEQFFQINRSEIVNRRFIEGYEKYIKNRVAIKTILNETILYTSNSRTPDFRKWMGFPNKKASH